MQDLLIAVGWVLFLMALVWTMLKPTLVMVLVLVAILCLVVFMIEVLE